MQCNKCQKKIIKIVRCNECDIKFCTVNCMMNHFFERHNNKNKNIKPPILSNRTSKILQKCVLSSRTPLSIKPKLLTKDIISLTKTEFDSYQPKGIKLGSGAYGVVYLAHSIKDNKDYAIKQMNKDIISTKLSDLQVIRKEIDIHSKLMHPNIIRLYNYYEDKDSINLILEYVPQGNLFTLLRKKRSFSEKEAIKYFKQAANAVEFLHKKNLIHRDIKPENLLLDNDNIIKLCDFGLCNHNNAISNRSTVCGTLEYMAPEILNQNSYDKSVDIWSLGILLYELTNGQTPFKQMNNQRNGVIFINQIISIQCKELIKKMLCYDAKKRISIKGVLDNPLIKGSNYTLSTSPQQITSVKIHERSSTFNDLALFNPKEKNSVVNVKKVDSCDGSITKTLQLNIDNSEVDINKKRLSNINKSLDLSHNSITANIDKLFSIGREKKIRLRPAVNKKIILNLDNTRSDKKDEELKKKSYLMTSQSKKIIVPKICLTNRSKETMQVMKKYPHYHSNTETNMPISPTAKPSTWNVHLMDAINLFEKAKEKKKEIEIPKEKLNAMVKITL